MSFEHERYLTAGECDELAEVLRHDAGAAPTRRRRSALQRVERGRGPSSG
jgi:hypothetical protein